MTYYNRPLKTSYILLKEINGREFFIGWFPTADETKEGARRCLEFERRGGDVRALIDPDFNA